MLVEVEQREYIKNFINFVGSFLVTEDATINEIQLVAANLEILQNRIKDIGDIVIRGRGEI